MSQGTWGKKSTGIYEVLNTQGNISIISEWEGGHLYFVSNYVKCKKDWKKITSKYYF